MDFLTLSKDFLLKDIDSFTLDDVKILQKLIKHHSDLYYNKQNPIISDKQYDDLFKKLEKLEQKYKDKLDFFQTKEVWAELKESSFKKVKHNRPMISLDNTYNEEDLKDFDIRVKKNLDLKDDNINIEYTLELKFDWLWIELIYESWEYKQAITRWNWTQWEDVTENIRQIENIPKHINYKGRLEVRWEVIMPISVFDNLNTLARKTWDKIFSNPRNAASWSVRTKDISLTKQRKLKFFAYDLWNIKEFSKQEQKNQYSEIIKILHNFWFEISPYFHICKNIDEIIYFINNFWDKRKEFDFEIDWLVIKVDNIDLWDKIWWTQHHPKFAIAYKFPAEILTTKILSVEHHVWRTWTITPVANLEAINIWWAIIRRATLHNYDEVRELDVRIWDTVFIKRAWEVIPKIISVVKQDWREDFKQILPPKFCPSCETLVKKDDNKVRYYCPNSLWCPAQHYEKLAFAVSKHAFNIDWLWEKQIELFLKEGIIHWLVDIFDLDKKRDELLALEWFKEKSVDNIIDAVNKAKNTDIVSFLIALQIPWIGSKTSKILSWLFKKQEDLLDFHYSIDDLEKINDIWPELAKNIIDFFTNDANKRLLKDLFEKLNIDFLVNSKKSWVLDWKKICITWSFIWKDWKKIWRDDIIKIIEENWWEFVSSVSKNLDFLVAWDKAWSKLKKAKDLWIPVLDLTSFLKSV